MIKVAYCINVLSSYRIPFYEVLSKNGKYDILVNCNILSGSIKSKFPEYTDPVGFKCFRHKPSQVSILLSKYLPQFWCSSSYLIRLIKYNPDIIVLEGLSNWANDLIILPYLLIKRIPFLWWGLGRVPGKVPRKYSITEMMSRMFIKFSMGCIAYHSHAARVFIEQGAYPDKVFIAFNSLDMKDNLCAIKSVGNQVNLSANVGGGGKLHGRILYSGVLEKAKKCDLLINAIYHIKRENELLDVELIIMGDGSERNNLEDMVNKYHLDNVYFVGHQKENATDYFLSSSVLVLPGLGGLAINHSFKHCTPVIVAQADGIEQDLVIDYQTGLIFKIDDCADLARKIIFILEHPEEAKEMGRKGYKLILEKFTIDHMVAGHLKAIDTTWSQRQ